MTQTITIADPEITTEITTKEQVVSAVLVEALTVHGEREARDVWPAVARESTRRLRQPVTDAYVTSLFWRLADAGVVDFGNRGTVWLSRTS